MCVRVITECESVRELQYVCVCVCVSDRQIMGCQKKRQVCVLVLSPLREEDPEKNRERGEEGMWRDSRLYLS